jgi:type IV secretory pathway VirB4 component
MSISRITKQRLFEDEALFNSLLPYAKWDENNRVFVHADASLWMVFELHPKWLTRTSDSDAFQLCQSIQETIDALDHTTSVQFNWVTTFDVEDLLQKNLTEYPTSGPAGWMARRWVRMIKRSANADSLHRRPRRHRLLISFRYDPPWRAVGPLQELQRALKILFSGKVGVSVDMRRAEYLGYANKFRGTIEGIVSKLNDLGFRPRRVDGQGIINLLYPLLNRRSIKSGKFKRGRHSSIPVPVYDPEDFLTNQLSDTSVEHPKNGVIKKDGRYYRTVSMVKLPKQCMPIMVAPLQSSPYENILSVTISKDPHDKQLRRLDALDSSLGFRERTGMGRVNQKIVHQISAIRTARQELYNNACQIVRVGMHQTFVCQTEDEVMRASAESVSAFTQMYGARAMVHEISDLGAMLTSLPACYDPATDGPGWTNMIKSSQAARMLPLWGNWRGSEGAQILLPSLWNRELVGFDLFDSNLAPNVLISGVSGAGKSYLLCFLLITLNRGHFGTLSSGQRVERQPITFVFDKGMTGQPCGFEKIAKLFGGKIYEATPSRAPAMNFLARLGETPNDPGNEDYKDLLDLCADIICDMATDSHRNPDRLERASVVDALTEAHTVYRSGPKRRELLLSDVAAVMRGPKRVDENQESAQRRQRIAVLIGDYYGSGTYAQFFDRPGGLKLKERFIVFDLKALSRNPDLQRVFLKVAMLWADTVMNTPDELDTRKVLVFDEAHDLIGKTASNTIETAFRLYRKRKGIVIAASQSGEDFYVGAGGQAIVQNSAHKIFLKQDPSKFHYTAQAFNLTQQQSDVVLRLRTVKGVESQFYLLSDIGEGAFVLPLEPSYYWVSTNNGDDNQLFNDVLTQSSGDFGLALQRVVDIAPGGAKSLHEARRRNAHSGEPSGDAVSNIVSGLIANAVGERQ